MAIVPGAKHRFGRQSPLEAYRNSRDDALATAQQRGLKATQLVMERAQSQLMKRLDQAVKGPGKDSFTAVQLQATLAQVRAVVASLEKELTATTSNAASVSAEAAAVDAVKYIKAADKKFTGLSNRLAIKEGALFDRSIRGAESSILHRLTGDTVAGPGIASRYGDAVVEQFEEILQQRFIQKTPWDEVREQLKGASSFLQGKPTSWAERIVRTEVMNAHGAASFNVIKGVDDQHGGMLKILSATFDNRTASDSYAVHGQIRRVGEPFEDWNHAYQHPPNRPNDREVIVPHNMAWPIPAQLMPRSDAEVAARWHEEGRKGSPPPRPLMTTVPLKEIGKGEHAAAAEPLAPTAAPEPKQKPKPAKKFKEKPAPPPPQVSPYKAPAEQLPGQPKVQPKSAPAPTAEQKAQLAKAKATEAQLEAQLATLTASQAKAGVAKANLEAIQAKKRVTQEQINKSPESVQASAKKAAAEAEAKKTEAKAAAAAAKQTAKDKAKEADKAAKEAQASASNATVFLPGLGSYKPTAGGFVVMPLDGVDMFKPTVEKAIENLKAQKAAHEEKLKAPPKPKAPPPEDLGDFYPGLGHIKKIPGGLYIAIKLSGVPKTFHNELDALNWLEGKETPTSKWPKQYPDLGQMDKQGMYYIGTTPDGDTFKDTNDDEVLEWLHKQKDQKTAAAKMKALDVNTLLFDHQGSNLIVNDPDGKPIGSITIPESGFYIVNGEGSMPSQQFTTQYGAAGYLLKVKAAQAAQPPKPTVVVQHQEPARGGIHKPGSPGDLMEKRLANKPAHIREAAVRFAYSDSREKLEAEEARKIRAKYKPKKDPTVWDKQYQKRKREVVPLSQDPRKELLRKDVIQQMSRRGGYSYAGDGGAIENMDVNITNEIRDGKPVTVVRFKMTDKAGDQAIQRGEWFETKHQFLGTDLSSVEAKISTEAATPSLTVKAIEAKGTEGYGLKMVRETHLQDLHQQSRLHAMHNHVEITLPGNYGAGTLQDIDAAMKHLGIEGGVSAPKPQDLDTMKLAKSLSMTSEAGRKALAQAAYDKGGPLDQQDVKAIYDVFASEETKRIYGSAELIRDSSGNVSLYSSELAKLWQESGARYVRHGMKPNLDTLKQMLLVDPDSGLLSSVERYKRGVFTRGASVDQDFQTGGADGVFTRIRTVEPKHGDDKEMEGMADGKRSWIVDIDPSELGRMDSYVFNGDNYGAAHAMTDRVKPDKLATSVVNRTWSSGNEMMFQKTVSPKSWRRVRIQDGTRAQVIAEFKKTGVTQINGIPLDQFFTD